MNSEGLNEHRLDTVKDACGIVLEIGFGSGLNLPYYKNVSKLYALEPSGEIYNLAQERISKISFPVEYIQAGAESIPLPDMSTDCVVSTFTLCSIPHLEKALSEVFRVLKPGGKFYFVEHGKSPNATISNIQNLFTPISKCIAGGCHMNRDIENYILNAGFKIQKLEKGSEGIKPLSYIYKGTAVKV